jgi:mersacidin/lichenicidin family type 2 lantibiotic
MKETSLIRAWKDEEYRESLTEAIESPVGTVELTDAELDVVAGGAGFFCGFSIFIGICKLTVGRCEVTVCAGSVIGAK